MISFKKFKNETLLNEFVTNTDNISIINIETIIEQEYNYDMGPGSSKRNVEYIKLWYKTTI